MSCELTEENMIPEEIYITLANAWHQQNVNFTTKNKFNSNAYNI